MIEKMKYINVMGPVSDLDRVIEKYISKYEIQLEQTSKELANEKGLSNFSAPNPYTAVLRKAQDLVKLRGIDESYKEEISKDEAVRTIGLASKHFDMLSKDLVKLQNKRDEYYNVASGLSHYLELEFNIEELTNFECLQYQFGRMPVSGFKQFEAFLYDDPEILLVKGKNDGEYLWGAYFTVNYLKEKVDPVFASLHFEKISLPLEVCGEKLRGTPRSEYDRLNGEIKNLDMEIATAQDSILDQTHNDKSISVSKTSIAAAYHKIKELSYFYDTRKFAAKTPNDFYIFVGWMPQRDADAMEKAIENDSSVMFIVEDDNDSILSKPPTKLKNNRLFQPFEFFVKMYGLPSYGEIDPTAFLAITYTILFGIMFGDLGQGMVLALLGLFLWKKKKMALGRIMSIIGCSSMLFGAIYGSFFGIEFEGLWLSPGKSGNTNTFLIYAVGMGVVLIIVSMSLNIFNALKRKRLVDVLFDPNGLAGVVFYVAVISIVLLFLTGHTQIGAWVFVIFIAVPLILIMFREPLVRLLKKKKELVHGGFAMYLLEAFIEMFEVLLSYFSNTVSFVRIGAIAISHASIMSIVMLLANHDNIFVIVFGNIFVIAMEGLISGIQVLRLEFYEIFSRFYEGGGRNFVSYKNNENK